MSGYPSMIVPVGHVEPVPRRIRAVLGDSTVLDSTDVRYVWEWVGFPQYYVPLGDVVPGALVDEGITQHSSRGEVRLHSLCVGEIERRHAARVLAESTIDSLSQTVRFEWEALDAWFEEDEQVFVHPRSPYTRVDALRSTREVRVELGGVVLAKTASPVMVFETGLPTRYYINRNEIDFSYLEASDTVTSCPYKGTTSGYWSLRAGDDNQRDLAWTYDFPTPEVTQIAGMIAFYNEKVDIFVDGELLGRPEGHVRANHVPANHVPDTND